MKRWQLILLCATAGGMFTCGPEAAQRQSCASTGKCPGNQVCSPQAVCVDPPQVDDGKPCASKDECKSDLCLNLGAGGVCATGCESKADCSASSVCVPVDATTLENTSPKHELRLLCRPAGTGIQHLAEACIGDQVCQSGICHQGRCTQPCGTCPSLMQCKSQELARNGLTLTHGLCTDNLFESIELGGVDVPLNQAAELSFTLPSGVTAFMVIADDKGDTRVAISSLTSPKNTRLVDFETPQNGLMRAYDYIGTASVQVSGTDNPLGKAEAGKYVVGLKLYTARFDKLEPVAGRIERVAVLYRRGERQGHLLDLDLHFAPATGITADKAATDPYVRDTLNQLEALYNELLGISLGEVRYHDLTATENSLKDSDALRALRVKYAVPGPNGLSINVYLVDQIEFGFEGLAGGIPGVPGLIARPGSGIAVRKQSTAAKMGKLLAHEIGHYLGLFHTTETGGNVPNDFLADTPACAVGAAVETCPDRQNLMFPFYLTAPDPLTLSAGQAAVVQGSPWLYETVYPEACGAGVAAVDISTSLYAGGSVAATTSQLSGTCGGASKNERVHLLRLDAEQAGKATIKVVATGFDPVVYVFSASCSGTQVACESGLSGKPLNIALSDPASRAYYIVVDGMGSANSNYQLWAQL